jgi:rRNA biogenesis protein RRP5
VVGAVKDIDDLELQVALPNHITGHVSITDMSAEITRMVELATQDDDEDDENEVCLAILHPAY